ncbi:MAG: M6 family metalloprotease domain-containing protein, partial [bacterium]
SEVGGTSLAAYYDRSSYSQLDLYGGTTLGWYSAPYPRGAVDPSDAGRDHLIKEALQHCHSKGHSFRQYDTNGDGMVDFFIVLWAGKDTGWATFWWAYQPGFSDESFSLDGVRFGKYAWTWESSPVGSAFDPATAIHETGHALGLPDYYDYDNTKGARGGLGGLDMMDSARYDHNCFSKWLLGWLDPRIVTGSSELIVLGPSETSKDCVLIWPKVGPDFQFGECFMVENRQKLGNDEALPGQGLVIWHVDARLEGDDFVCNNSFTDHKLLRLMEADGLEEIEAGGLADAEDFYRAGMSFGCDTVPSSNGYNNQASGLEVKNISAEGARMSATFAVAPAFATVLPRNPGG